MYSALVLDYQTWCNQSKRFTINQLHSYHINVISIGAILLHIYIFLKLHATEQVWYTEQTRPFYFRRVSDARLSYYLWYNFCMTLFTIVKH